MNRGLSITTTIIIIFQKGRRRRPQFALSKFASLCFSAAPLGDDDESPTTNQLCSSQNYRFLDVDKFSEAEEEEKEKAKKGGATSMSSSSSLVLVASATNRFIISRLRKHCQYEIIVQVRGEKIAFHVHV